METSTKVLVATGAVVTAALKSTGVGPKAEPPTPHEAARFLTQATWRPTDTDIAGVQALGFAGWIDAQIQTAGEPGQHLHAPTSTTGRRLRPAAIIRGYGSTKASTSGR